MKKYITILFVLLSFGVSAQITTAQRLTNLETLTKSQTQLINSLTVKNTALETELIRVKNFRVVVVGATVNKAEDTIWLPSAKSFDTAYTKFRLDSNAAALRFIQTAMIVYNGNSINRDADINKRINELPVSTAIDLTPLNTAIAALQAGQNLTNEQVDNLLIQFPALKTELLNLKSYLKNIQ